VADGRRRFRSRQPRPHWVLVGILVAAVLVALLAQGYARRQVGRSTTVAPGAPAPAPPGSLLSYSGGQLHRASPPPMTVALTFDDGPDPTWTPKLLALLREKHVPATFFVVGTQAVSHPDLVRRELAAGHDVGSHTFTHADLSSLPRWRQNLEHSLTQTALAGAASVHTALLRPPYSSTPADLTGPEADTVARAARLGYLVSLADRDGEDWRRPGVGRIVANSEPAGDRGAVVLLHDGGGDRSQTLAAVSRVIDDLRLRGFQFRTVSQLAAENGRATTPVHGLAHERGLALQISLRAAFTLVDVLTWLLLPLGILVLLRALIVAAFARRHARRRTDLLSSQDQPPVSIIVPAYNESVGIAAAVTSLASSRYGDLEVIVVDDGSTDGTADIVDRLGLKPVQVVRQVNAGKSAALNTGLRLARHEVIVCVDADTQFETDTLAWLVRPFADSRVGAVSGNTKVANRGRLIGRWQHIEYVMGFNLDRRLYDVLDCMPTVPGAVGAFRRRALIDIGGISEDTLAEDTDVTIAVNRAGWRVVYEERALAWTEAPATWGELWRQRYRWCYGTLQAMWKHRAAVLQRSGGHVGRRGIPYVVGFQVLLPLLAPLVDLLALYGLLFYDPWLVLAYWAGFNLVQLALAAYAFRLDREPLRPLWALPLQQFVYRQFMYAVIVQSVVAAIAGIRLRWHKLERTGIAVPPERAQR
jgi:cellulose synthase/poly-beta-1,6-N-acetylglucosamine synthase-like glycosyltransferase/peptidoglycan/xylan/chitin deacetylase (PgdA/CDA1 family)